MPCSTTYKKTRNCKGACLNTCGCVSTTLDTANSWRAISMKFSAACRSRAGKETWWLNKISHYWRHGLVTQIKPSTRHCTPKVMKNIWEERIFVCVRLCLHAVVLFSKYMVYIQTYIYHLCSQNHIRWDGHILAQKCNPEATPVLFTHHQILLGKRRTARFN